MKSKGQFAKIRKPERLALDLDGDGLVIRCHLSRLLEESKPKWHASYCSGGNPTCTTKLRKAGSL